MVKKQRAYKRSQRKLQVIEQLLIWNENDYAKEVTSYKLAKALDLRPTQHFADILNEMVEDGDLERVCREQSGRWSTFFYYLASHHLSRRNVSRRKIAVKSRGVAVGQLEMFTRQNNSGWQTDYESDLREREKSTTGENLLREQMGDMQASRMEMFSW